MGLFDRQKTNYETSAPLYTLGNSKTLLVIGLGNVGAKYHKTRHNIGFAAVDRYKESHDFSDWIEKKDLQSYQATGQVGDTRVILAKPTTLMNNSGEAAQKLQRFYKLSNEDMLVIYDDLDVAFGTIRTRGSGGAAGHKGIKSLLSHVKDGFGRIRVGIGPVPYLHELSTPSDSSAKRKNSVSSLNVSSDMSRSQNKVSASSLKQPGKRTDSRKQGKPAKMDSADFVLQKFTEKQEGDIPKILREISALIDERTVDQLEDTTLKVI